ncbi:unnamed protein product [Oikopleura dioica]|uniref:Pannexin n=1 Tax=Oikopleura dioica TaxID=34765 RepID=E4XAJ4_OIKDI|nr:unnamed protein product [Oikopleura dioica]
MSILGIIQPDKYLSRFSRESKRHESLPFIMHKPDRLLLHLLVGIYALASAGAVTVGLDLYRKSGLSFVNTKVNGTKIYDSDEVSEMLDYCWTNFNHEDESGDVYELWHFRLFPYILVVITIAISGAQLSWRAMNFDEAIHALDFIIDGLEEAIRDIIIQMRNAIKKVDTARKAIVVDGACSTLSDLSDENSAAFLVKEHEKDVVDSDSSKPLKTHLHSRKGYGSLRRTNDCDYVTLDKIYAEIAENDDWKFANFNKILLKYYKRSSFRCKFTVLRTLTFLLVFFSNFFIYYQLIAPARNPTTISCPIPVELQHIRNVKREQFQFSNTETRVLLALVTFSVSTAVFAGGMIMWFFTPAWDNAGIKLVEVLPVLRNKEIRRMRRGVWNDLIYLLSLVHVNRFRSLELRIAFYVLAVSEQLPADDGDDSSVESRKKKFIKLMMELIAWPSDSDEQTNATMESLANNFV